MICIKSISNPFIRSHITSHHIHGTHSSTSYKRITVCWTTMKNRNRIQNGTTREKRICLHLLFHTIHSLVQLHRTNGTKYVCTERANKVNVENLHFFCFNIKSNICVQPVPVFGAKQKKYAYQISSVQHAKPFRDGTEQQQQQWQKRWIIEARIELLALSRIKTNRKSVECLCNFFCSMNLIHRWWWPHLSGMAKDMRITPDMTEKKHTDAWNICIKSYVRSPATHSFFF